MCGQFAMLGSLKAIKDYYEFLKNGAFSFDVNEYYDFESDLLLDLPEAHVKPISYLPIIAVKTGRVAYIKAARWGLVPSWAKDESFAFKTINARIETVHEKASFKKAYQQRRCLVPMTGFYERGGDKKLNYFTNEGDGMKSFAGLWEIWDRSGDFQSSISKDKNLDCFVPRKDNRCDKSSQELVTFTIITCQADERVSGVHGRMPVVLDKIQAIDWLNGEKLAV